MNTEFGMELVVEGAAFVIQVEKQKIKFAINTESNDGICVALTLAELKDLAKICHFAWENSAALMRAPTEEKPNDE